MKTGGQAQSASDRYPQVASPIHTILVLAALGGWAIWHKSFAQLNLTANPNRVLFYVVTIFLNSDAQLVVPGCGPTCRIYLAAPTGDGNDWRVASELGRTEAIPNEQNGPS